MLRARIIVTGALVILTSAACGSGSSSGGPTAKSQSEGGSSGTIAGLKANNHGQQDVTGKSAVTIEADNYYFQPSVLKGTAGQKITLTIDNGSSTEHNFSVGAQNINKDVSSHAKVTATVTFPSSGVLSFYCSYHKSQGMVGGLLTAG